MILRHFIGCAISLLPLFAFASNNDLTLTVTHTAVGCDVELKMEILNNTADTITMYGDTLPWSENIFGAALIAKEVGVSGATLQQMHMLAHSMAIIKKIESQKTLQGSIKLKGRFPELSERLRKTEVVLYWNYVLRDQKNTFSTINAGAIVLQKCTD